MKAKVEKCTECDGKGTIITDSHDCWGKYEPHVRNCICSNGYIVKKVLKKDQK